jgi:hypothetical protein
MVAPTATPAFAPIPGLSQTITVPSGAVVYIATDGPVTTTSALVTGVSFVQIAVAIDNVIPTGGTKQVQVLNTTGAVGVTVPWSFSLSPTVAPGTHTVAVFAAAASASGSTANVGTASGSNLAKLTVMILKQ